MAIPTAPRVIYQKPALDEVICQLRFPPVLRVGVGEPAEFQDAIREHFPFFEERLPMPSSDLPQAITRILPDLSNMKTRNRVFDFLSEDREWKVSLTNDFLALSTQKYVRWEGFREHLFGPLEELNKIYQPSFFQRVGLRYRDVIVRSQLGLDDVPWSELLQPYIVGELGRTDAANDVIESEHEVLLKLEGSAGQVRVRHFLAKISETNEPCYVIDADFFSEQKTEREHAIEKLDTLNRYAGRLFRWCITKRLYEAMDPESVS